MRLAALLCALVAGLPCAAETVHGSGHAATEERTVSGVTGIAASVPGRLEVLQADREAASVTADDNVVPRIETFVDRGVLRIRFARGSDVHPRTPIRIVVRVRSLDRIALAGAVALEAPRLNAERLSVDLAGAGQAMLPELTARELSLHTSGHCHAMAAGRVDAFELHMAGSGEVNAARLEARRASVLITGSAATALWVRDRLEAGVTGSGAVRYFGDPVVEKRIRGSGRVERLGAAPP